MQRLAKAGLSADSVCEIERNKGVIRDYLTQEKEYGAENLSRPTSLNMRSISSIAYTEPTLTRMTNIGGSLPSLIRFHAEYYREFRRSLDINTVKKSDLPRDAIDDICSLMSRHGTDLVYKSSYLKRFFFVFFF